MRDSERKRGLSPLVLAGDVGGTSTRLALADGAGDLRVVEVYRSRDYTGLGEILARFLQEHPASIERACVGIAGPVRDGRVETPNLPWRLDARALAAQLALPSVVLLNDLEANAYGVFTLGAPDFAVLNPGRHAVAGSAAILSPGTGLGEAGLHGEGATLRPFASEGGHADFAPRTDLEIDLLRWLRDRFGRVSYERVLSGPGLANVHTFLREAKGRPGPALDDPAAISQAALAGTSPAASEALELFVSLLGAEAGNLALKMNAVRGVYVGGGIAPKILPRLMQPGFLEAFTDKGRFRAYMEAIPVKVILNDRTALRGAAFRASLSP